MNFYIQNIDKKILLFFRSSMFPDAFPFLFQVVGYARAFDLFNILKKKTKKKRNTEEEEEEDGEEHLERRPADIFYKRKRH